MTRHSCNAALRSIRRSVRTATASTCFRSAISPIRAGPISPKRKRPRLPQPFRCKTAPTIRAKCLSGPARYPTFFRCRSPTSRPLAPRSAASWLAAERGASGLLVGERQRKKVGYLAGPLKHFALIVGAVLHLKGCGNRGRLRFGEIGPARIGEIAERKQVEAVAVRTDLLIDLKAALQLCLVIETERAPKRPTLARRRVGLLRHCGAGAAEHDRKRQSKGQPVITFHASGSLTRARPAPAPRPERHAVAPIPRLNSAAAWFSRKAPRAAGSRRRRRNNRR